MIMVDEGVVPIHKVIAVGYLADCYDDWVVYWSDGVQVAGCTFAHLKGGCGERAVRCAFLNEGPGLDVDDALRWSDVPRVVQLEVVKVMAAWDESVDEVI